MSIGIVIPTYNSGKYIEDTLKNLLPLKQQNPEIIAVDSGSTDDTLELLKNYGIKTVYCPPGNMYEAINLGFSLVSKKWLTYINSDDILNTRKLLDFLQLYSADIEKYDFFCGKISHIDEDGLEICTRTLLNERLLKVALLNGDPILPQPGTFFKKSTYEKLGGFDINFRFSSDFDFFIRAVKQNCRFFISENANFASFRLHGNQISETQKYKMLNETLQIFRKNKLSRRISFSIYLRALLFLKNLKF